MAVYTFEDDLGNLLAMKCAYISTGPQRGEIAAQVTGAPYSPYQTVSSDGHAKFSAYKLEGVEVDASIPGVLDGINTFIKKSKKLHRSNDSTLELIPGPHAEAVWEYDASLNVSKVVVAVYTVLRLDMLGTETAPPLPVEVVTVPGPPGDPGPAGTPGRGVPLPTFSSDEGKVPFARGAEDGKYRLEPVQNALEAGNGITLTTRPGNKVLITSTATGGGSDPTLSARVAALEQQILSLDTVPPAVGLASSSNNVTTASSVTLTAAPTDNIAVSKVEFYRVGVTPPLGTRLAAPWTQTVPLTSSDNGTVSFTARAFDSHTPVPNATVSNQVDVTVTIGAANQPPVAAFTTSTSGLTVNTTNTSSDPDGDLLSFFWTFGDGTPADTSVSPSHTYAAPGTYTVTLVASDAALSSTLSASVVVSTSNTTISEGFEDTTYPDFTLLNPGAYFNPVPWTQDAGGHTDSLGVTKTGLLVSTPLDTYPQSGVSLRYATQPTTGRWFIRYRADLHGATLQIRRSASSQWTWSGSGADPFNGSGYLDQTVDSDWGVLEVGRGNAGSRLVILAVLYDPSAIPADPSLARVYIDEVYVILDA